MKCQAKAQTFPQDLVTQREIDITTIIMKTDIEYLTPFKKALDELGETSTLYELTRLSCAYNAAIMEILLDLRALIKNSHEQS